MASVIAYKRRIFGSLASQINFRTQKRGKCFELASTSGKSGFLLLLQNETARQKSTMLLGRCQRMQKRLFHIRIGTEGKFGLRGAEIRFVRRGWEFIQMVTKKHSKAVKTDAHTYSSEFWPRKGFAAWYIFHPLGRFISATSIACVRSQFAPKFLAFIVGEITWMGKCAAETGQNQSLCSSYGQKDIQSTSIIFSMLEGLVLCMRAVYLLLVFAPILLSAPFADKLDGKWRQAWLELVRLTLEHAGAAFIKWGQWAATRPDLFPKDLCNQLSMLHTKAPAHGFAQTRYIIENAFGRKLDEIFEEFDEEPVASGSIAQVHRAILKFPYGDPEAKATTVAVKVRHPGVGDVIRRDFNIINGLARLSSLFPSLKWWRLEESVQQFAIFMLTQVDLAREAAHLSRFIYNFRSWKDVSFPKPLYPLVHPAVLVETYEQGESVSRFVDRPEKTSLNSALAHIGTHTLLKMLLVDNFIHADLHPGNILVRVRRGIPPSGKGLFRSHPHVILLDVGMTAELSHKDRLTLLDFFKAVAKRDGRKAAECTLRFSSLQTCPDPRAFMDEVEGYFDFLQTRKAVAMNTGDYMQELLEQVRRHKVNIDGDICTVIVTTLVLEGWQRKLDPEYNIMDTLQRVLFKTEWASSLSYTIDSLMAP